MGDMIGARKLLAAALGAFLSASLDLPDLRSANQAKGWPGRGAEALTDGFIALRADMAEAIDSIGHAIAGVRREETSVDQGPEIGTHQEPSSRLSNAADYSDKIVRRARGR